MVEDYDKLNLMQSKGGSTTHLLSLEGKRRFSEIRKSCGCVFGEKCKCKQSTGGIDYEQTGVYKSG